MLSSGTDCLYRFEQGPCRKGERAETAAVLIVALLTYVVAVCDLSHVIAGSVEAAYAVLRGHAAVQDYLLRFFAPTLLGNVVGGIALVDLLNHASIAPEMSGRG